MLKQNFPEVFNDRRVRRDFSGPSPLQYRRRNHECSLTIYCILLQGGVEVKIWQKKPQIVVWKRCVATIPMTPFKEEPLNAVQQPKKSESVHVY